MHRGPGSAPFRLRSASSSRAEFSAASPILIRVAVRIYNRRATRPAVRAARRQRVLDMMLLPFILAVQASLGEGDLVERLQRRDPQALADLYDRYGRLVYALI